MILKRENPSRSSPRSQKPQSNTAPAPKAEKPTEGRNSQANQGQRRSRTQTPRSLAKRGGQTNNASPHGPKGPGPKPTNGPKGPSPKHPNGPKGPGPKGPKGKGGKRHGAHNRRNSKPPIQKSVESMTQKLHDQLKITIIGGNQEVGGKNMTVVEFEDDILIIDMGLKFPEEDMHGIDYIIPNISYLKGKEKNIRAIALTHGHLDHIGGISHLVPELGNPIIYTGNFTAAMIKRRHEEHKNVAPLNVKICDENSSIKVGKMTIEFVPLNHSIPDTFGILVHTPVGTVFHNGDFKFDFSPVYGEPANLARLAEIGEKGLLALLSDSTGAVKPGYQISEKIVGVELEKAFRSAKKRIFVGSVASNLSRLIQILQLAEKLGRKVALEGRSINNIIDIAFELGYLKLNRNMIIDGKNIRKYRPEEVMVICTGSQGETNAVLPRVVGGEHPYLSLEPDDTIILSASIIPGNEVTISKMMDGIYKHGCNIINYRMMQIHAGGHGCAEDGKLMVRLTKPEYFIPIEGSYSFLKSHADNIKAIGFDEKKIYLPENGQIMEFYKPEGKNETIGVLTENRVVADDVMVDGLGVGDVSNIVLRDRQVMAEDGMFVIIITVNKAGEMIGNPDIISRGFVYMKDNRQLIEGARRKVKTIFKKHKKTGSDTRSKKDINDIIKGKMRDDISLYLYKNMKRRPMVLPVIIDV